VSGVAWGGGGAWAVLLGARAEGGGWVLLLLVRLVLVVRVVGVRGEERLGVPRGGSGRICRFTRRRRGERPTISSPETRPPLPRTLAPLADTPPHTSPRPPIHHTQPTIRPLPLPAVPARPTRTGDRMSVPKHPSPILAPSVPIGTQPWGERGGQDDLDGAVRTVRRPKGKGLAGAGGHHGRGARGAELVVACAC